MNLSKKNTLQDFFYLLIFFEGGVYYKDIYFIARQEIPTRTNIA